MFNFQEIVDVFFGARAGLEEKVDILSEVIPLAKASYIQSRVPVDRSIMRRADLNHAPQPSERAGVPAGMSFRGDGAAPGLLG